MVIMVINGYVFVLFLNFFFFNNFLYFFSSLYLKENGYVFHDQLSLLGKWISKTVLMSLQYSWIVWLEDDSAVYLIRA